MSDIETVRWKSELLRPVMDRKVHGLWCACEAHAFGPEGDTAVSIVTGVPVEKIRMGMEMLGLTTVPPSVSVQGHSRRMDRIRRPGGGRKRVEIRDPTIITALESMLSGDIAGDPMGKQRWIRASTTNLSKRLKDLGYEACPVTVNRLLKQMGYSMRANSKRQVRNNSPGRDEQFKYIASQRNAFSEAGLPVISVDAKKNELIGNFSNKGKTWRKKAEDVNQNDYPSKALCRATPYGIYDVANNTGYVSVGTSNNTPEFAVEAIFRWWKCKGSAVYRGKKQLCILADGGGNNGWRSRSWKKNLQEKISDGLGLTVTVCHYPTGCAKWNPADHRLFSYISVNWAGRPLRTLDIMLGYIRGTTTEAGLTVEAHADEGVYEKGQRVTKAEMEDLNIWHHTQLPDWNYTIGPREATGQLEGFRK